jgi:hypothetical protein
MGKSQEIFLHVGHVNKKGRLTIVPVIAGWFAFPFIPTIFFCHLLFIIGFIFLIIFPVRRVILRFLRAAIPFAVYIIAILGIGTMVVALKVRFIARGPISKTHFYILLYLL